MEEKLISVEKLTKKYGGKIILNDVTFDIFKGDKIALIGPNGVGKTTLLEILTGIKKQSSGNVSFSFAKNKHEISKKIGFQFQESYYPPKIKVKDVVDIYLKSFDLTPQKVEDL